MVDLKAVASATANASRADLTGLLQFCGMGLPVIQLGRRQSEVVTLAHDDAEVQEPMDCDHGPYRVQPYPQGPQEDPVAEPPMQGYWSGGTTPIASARKSGG